MIKLIKTLFNGKKEDNNSDSNEKNDLLSLAPTIKADNIESYVPFFDSALEDKDENGNIVNKNIAVTGGYGSGKSSIIKSYFENKMKDKYKGRVIYITLGNYVENSCTPLGEETKEENKFYTYKDGIDEEDEKDKKIENKTVKTVHKSNSTDDQVEISILQQILYYVRPKRIPFSRFHRIDKHNDKLDEIIYNLISLIIVILISFVFILIFKSKSIYDFKDIIFDRYCILYGIILFFPSYFIISYVNRRFKVNKISFDNLELSKGGIEESILNKYLDELIHFFLYNKYDIVIFEDLDRLDNCKLFFSKLKEINAILNNSVSNKTIRFIYAVKDDLFDDCEKRTKFVDVIIPIVPFISTFGYLQKNENESIMIKSISKPTRKCILKYIKNARYFKDIENEFNIYKNNYMNKRFINKMTVEDLEQLFWLISYKILYPNRFQLLVEGDTILYYILDKEIMRDLYIERRKEMLKSIDCLNIENKEYINVMNEYIKELLQIQKEVNANENIDSKKYFHFLTKDKQVIDLEKILREKDGYDLLFDNELFSLENEKGDRNGELFLSKYKKTLISYDNFIQNINKIKKLNDNIKDNYDYDLNKILKKIRQDLPNIKCEDLNTFEYDMVNMKKIRFNYRDLIMYKSSNLSYYDERFILNISSSKKVEFDEFICDEAEVFNTLSPIDFSYDGICNISLFEYINTLDVELYYDVFFENLTDTKMQFLFALYYNFEFITSFDKFTKYFNHVWNYIMINNYADEILDFWICMTIFYNTNLTMRTHIFLNETIKNHMSLDNVLENFILENLENNIPNNAFYKILSENLAKFRFDYNSKSEYKTKNKHFLSIIYDNSLFQYNISLISSIIKMKGIVFDSDKLLRILYDNKEIIENIYNHVFSNFSIALDSFKKQLYILEKDDELYRNLFLKKIISEYDIEKIVQDTDFEVNDLSIIPVSLLKKYLELHEFNLSWNNVLFLLKNPEYMNKGVFYLNYKIDFLLKNDCNIKVELTDILSAYLDDLNPNFIEKLMNYKLLQTNNLEILWNYRNALKNSMLYPNFLDSCLPLLISAKNIGIIRNELAIDIIDKCSNKADAAKFLIKHIKDNNYWSEIKNKIAVIVMDYNIKISKSVCEYLIKDIYKINLIPFGRYCSSKFTNIIDLFRKSNEFQQILSYSSCKWTNNDDNLWFANVLKENKLGEYKIENNKIEMTIY